MLAGFMGLLLVLAALRPLAHPDEGRYAEIGRWMLQSGDWLIPRLNGLPFFHKPPLLYWLEALSLATFGIHPWAARLVPALHAGLMLLVVYLTARRVGSEHLARRAAVMLGTSLAFLAGGQYVNHDMMVATWISVAIGCFALAFLAGDKPDPQLARIGFIACALGILSKGLIGVALPGLVLLIWLIWTGQFKKIKSLPWFSGLGLFGVIAIPWFVLAEQKVPHMLSYIFGTQQFERFTTATFNNNRPWWFYIVCLLIIFFPWAFFALAQKIRGFPTKNIATPTASAEAVEQAAQPTFPPAVISLCWIWVVAIIGFFSFPAAKIVGYALPVIPPLAMLATAGWQTIMGHRRHERQIFLILCVVNVALGLGLTVMTGLYTKKHSALDLEQTLACLAKPGDTYYVMDGYPYDLPFILKMNKPMIVVQDWAALRLDTADNWHRELLDAADFDPINANVLQTAAQLELAKVQSGNWLLINSNASGKDALTGWIKVKQGAAWTLYRSAPPNAAPSSCADAHLK